MQRPLPTILFLIVLVVLAGFSLRWGGMNALSDSADLERRVEEVDLFVQGQDPFNDPDMTYPPSAPPVFTALIVPIRGTWLRPSWFGLNLVALFALCATIVAVWGRAWPGWVGVAFCLAVTASKPVRAGLGLGQFHLMPTALVIAAIPALRAKRPILAGVLVGLALIKPTMAVPFVIVLITWGEWTALATCLSVQAALFAGTSLWLRILPTTLVAEWLRNAKTQLGEGIIDVPTLLQRAFPSTSISASTVSVVVLGVSFGILWVLRRKSTLGQLAVSLYLAAILTYHRPYDLVLLLPTLAYFVDCVVRSLSPMTILQTVLFAALLIAPNHPSIAGNLDQLYDQAYPPAAYLALIALIIQVAREPEIDAPA